MEQRVWTARALDVLLMMENQKVFCVGFMKTGTTTMHQALSILGYNVSSKSHELLPAILHNNMNAVVDHCKQYDAFEDNPIPLLYAFLDEQFPGSKFILTTREAESWYASVSHHIGWLRTPMHEYVFGKGRGIPSQDKEHTIRVFENHNQAVIDYFSNRPEDLMIIPVNSNRDWKPLCDFLDKPIPETAFPHANKTEYSKPKFSGFKRITKRSYRFVKCFFVLRYYYFRGLIPTKSTTGQ